MSYIDGDIENGIYYFMAVSHDHHSHVHDEPKQAVTAGSKSGDLLTVEPHEPPNYERQQVSAFSFSLGPSIIHPTAMMHLQWDVTRVSHDVYHIESVSSRGNWIGFERMAENEPFIISSTKRDIAIYYHPRPNGRGDWMLRVQHENPTPMVVAADPLQQVTASMPQQPIVMGFFDSEAVVNGLHMFLKRVGP